MAYINPSEKTGVKLPAVMNEDDFITLLKATRMKHHRLAFILAFYAGLRISEVCKLQKSDIDFKRHLMFVRQGKWGKDRYVPLPKLITPKSLKYIPMKCGHRSLQKIFKRYLKIALDRDDLHFHNLRHSFATNLLGKGIPITEVQMWLGHSNLDTTAIYLKVSPDHALKNYQELI